MRQLLIRNLDEEIVERLKARAKAEHRSLQSEVKVILEQAARQNHAAAWQSVERFRERLKRSRRGFTDSTELVREDRDR